MTLTSTAQPPMLAARYHDGVLARPHPVDLQISSDGIVLCGPALQRNYDWKSTQVSERLQHAPRMLRFTDGTFCEVTDQQGLDAALAGAGYRDSWIARSQRRWSHVIGATLLLLAAIWGGYRWGLPVAADLAARGVPPDVESGIGARAAQIVEQQFAPSRLPQLERDRIERLFDSIAPRDGRKFALLLRNGGPLGANAFALPGGTVVVTDQLVELAARHGRAPALAGVLAHEIGHIELRHVMRQLIAGTVVGAVVTVIAGDTSGLMAALPATLTNLSYSRDMEREADRYAVDTLKRKGIPIGPFADLLQRLQTAHKDGEEPGWSRYLQTHPDTEDRIAAIRAAAAR